MSSFEFGVSGHYTFKLNGKVVAETDNLITNAGLIALINNNNQVPISAMTVSVGSGNTAPANGNTALVAVLGAKTGGVNYTSGELGASPNQYFWQRAEFQFPLGGIVGTVAEVGCTFVSSASLHSRALVSPTVIVLATDQLTVTYEMRIYYPAAATTGNVTIAGTSYAWSGAIAKPVRASGLTNWTMMGHPATPYVIAGSAAFVMTPGTTPAPTSPVALAHAVTRVITNATLLTTCSLAMAVGEYNVTGGLIRSLTMTGDAAGAIGCMALKFTFTAGIPKTAAITRTITYNYIIKRV